jgi:hypothetical protein
MLAMCAIKQVSLVSALLLSVVATNAHAALYDRGNGMIYDSTQNITWLQDANYANTSGYTSTLPGYYFIAGRMTWEQSTSWVNDLVYGGYSGWRLPSASLVGNENYSPNGSTNSGYNNTRSEVGHLFFELGNKSAYTLNGIPQSGSGLTNTIFVDAGTGQSVSFLNLQKWFYWEAEASASYPDHAWEFNTNTTRQDISFKTSAMYAWAVHDGDVANVPVPAAAWLFGAGLVGLLGARRKSD